MSSASSSIDLSAYKYHPIVTTRLTPQDSFSTLGVDLGDDETINTKSTHSSILGDEGDYDDVGKPDLVEDLDRTESLTEEADGENDVEVLPFFKVNHYPEHLQASLPQAFIRRRRRSKSRGRRRDRTPCRVIRKKSLTGSDILLIPSLAPAAGDSNIASTPSSWTVVPADAPRVPDYEILNKVRSTRSRSRRSFNSEHAAGERMDPRASSSPAVAGEHSAFGDQILRKIHKRTTRLEI